MFQLFISNMAIWNFWAELELGAENHLNKHLLDQGYECSESIQD